MSTSASNVGLFVLRFGAGGLLLFGHGVDKAQALLAGAADFPDPLHLGPRTSLVLAALTEVVCSAAVMVGAATRLAAAGVTVTMAIAALVVNHGAAWSDVELGLIYGVPFLALVLLGPGAFSVDAAVVRWRARR